MAPGKSTRRRRPGAPPGNKNALKHGLYARTYTATGRTGLGDMPPLESIHEIYMLRDRIARLIGIIDRCTDEDRLVRLYNALFSGVQRLLAAMRTHNFLVGDNHEQLTDFWTALKLYQDEQGL